MTGEAASMTGEDKDAAPEPDWTSEFTDVISKDPEGWEAWLQAITSSAKSRSAFQENVLSKVMAMVTREWECSSPRKIARSQIKAKLKAPRFGDLR